MNFDLVIHNGTIVTSSDTFQADVGVLNGKIAVLGLNLRGDAMVDASGLYVLPGGVDPHVHLEMPAGRTTSSDDWKTGTQAAACGGTTTVIDFVEPEAGETLLEAYQKRRNQAEVKSNIDFGLHMTLTSADRDTLAQIPGVMVQGMPSFKMYTTYEGFKLTDREFLQCFVALHDAGGMAIVHAENDAIIQSATETVLTAGITGPRGHPLSRPPIAEVEAITRILFLAQYADVPLYIVHISTAGGASAVELARHNGQQVYGETCPQYLLLTADEYQHPDFRGAKFVCSPPLRSETDQVVLWEKLSDGQLDTVGTDHCPFFMEGQKDLGREVFTEIPGGLPGIQPRLSLVYTFGVGLGRLSLNQWVKVCCTAPAQIFGLYPRKGTIAPGADADLVLFDPQVEVTLSHERLSENVDYTPYEGIELRGYPVKAFLRGALVAADNQFVGAEVKGQYVHRSC